ncbi:MAG: TonB-dependent receptor [Betaproteobacteria bacterium]|nr:TonB-dependent receptor [Rhodocyclaceae bacterium]MCE2898238.1 TonB-dependent receptor [Betaproteobacteria bacterium]
MRPAPTRLTRSAISAAVAAAFAGPAVADNDRPATLEAPTVKVIGVTPLPGVGLPLNKVPGNVQTLTAKDVQQQQAVGLPDLMTTALPSVNVNDVQGNPFQPDVNYRGFTASPLLGLPQGLSVFQDGVRINEPFGDVVNWALVPLDSISTMNVIPGSNPLFGLNTLGGALSLRTKSGFQFPNTAFELSGGSWGRANGKFEHGGYSGNKDYYIAGNWFKEDGWRQFSPSEVKSFFAKSGWQDGRTDLDVSLTLADTNLTGNGVAPQSFLNQSRNRIFTQPDQTIARTAMLNFTGSHWLNDTDSVQGNVYMRGTRIRTLNGDANDGFEGGAFDGDTAAVDGGLCPGAGCNTETGANNRSRTNSRSFGANLQWTRAVQNNQFTFGGSYDNARADFRSTQTLGVVNADRGVTETNATTDEAALIGRTVTSSLFLTDTWTFRPNWHLTGSARYNYTRVKNNDTLNPGVAGNLDGNYVYPRLNPAVGLNWTPSDALTVYGTVNQGNRAPTPIELGCADPANPCRLPNAMAADPFLKQVVATTVEVGARGMFNEWLGYSSALFRTINRDDILFVSTTTSAGFFTNFGRTQRQGVELGLTGAKGRWDFRANYTYLRATFESAADLLAENNSSRGFGGVAADDQIRVRPGDRIPGIPQHQFRINANYRLTDAWTVGANVIAMTGVYARGNENNQHQAGTVTDPIGGDIRTFTGAGKTSDYTVLNLVTNYKLTSQWQLFGRINNVFDNRFNTAAILAENPFNAAGVFQTNSGDWARETFYGPGAPRAAWIGVRYFLERQPR